MTNHLGKFLFKVLKVYGVSITQYTIEKTVLIHPEFPSILSVSDAFDSWKIKHVVMKLSLEKMRALDVPVIAPLKKGEYVWVTQITDSKVHFWNGNGTEKIENQDQFENEWSGVALAIEDVTDAGDSNYREERGKEVKESIIRYGISGGCMALFAMLACFSWTNDSMLSLFQKALLFLVNAAGCSISYLLILQEKRHSNRLVQKFCTAGTHIDCNKVTASRYSKLFGLISWAELGMAYFSATTLWVAIAPVSTNWLVPLWLVLLVPILFVDIQRKIKLNNIIIIN